MFGVIDIDDEYLSIKRATTNTLVHCGIHSFINPSRNIPSPFYSLFFKAIYLVG